MARNIDWKGKTGGGNIGQKFLYLYLKHGSITFTYVILTVVIPFYLLINYKATVNIFNYFRKRQKYDILKSCLSTYLNHFLFGKTLIDKFALFSGRQKLFSVKIEGQEKFDAIVNNPDKGAIIINSHIGSAEIAGYFLGQNKKKLNAIVFGGESEEVQQKRRDVLEVNNIHMIPVVDGFSHIFAVYNALKNAELVNMAGDRIYQGSKNIAIDFMGDKAGFPVNAFQLAVKLKVPVLGMFVMQDGNKKYKCFVKNINANYTGKRSKQEQIEFLMKQYVSYLEEILKKYPLQWYNFYDFWKK